MASVESATYPDTDPTPPSDASTIAHEWVTSFNQQVLSAPNYACVSHLFFDESYWRDHLCLSWDFHTFHGVQNITSMLEHSLNAKACMLISIAIDGTAPSREPKLAKLDSNGEILCIQAMLDLKTKVGGGRGVVRLLKDSKDSLWKAYTLYTSLQSLDGHAESTKFNRPSGVEKRKEGSEPAVLIIGAGQAGLLCASRLKQLNVSTLIIDRNERVGDNWRNRYRSLILHDPVWYNHFPYLPFPETWPVFTPKDKLADWMHSYAQSMDLNVLNSTALTKALWTGIGWEVILTTTFPNGAVRTRTLRPRHIIQATGQAGEPKIPLIPGMSLFRGPLSHSSHFRGATPNGNGKHVIVLGSSNSAHDIAQDYYNNGYDVTMIQRSSICVDPTRYFKGKGLYTEDGPSTEDADLLSYSVPIPVLKRNEIEGTRILEFQHKEFFERLRSVGFLVDSGPDGAGRKLKFLEKGGGYYIDVGASALIMDGHIKVKSGEEISSITAHSVILTDGTELPADEVVFATGYKSMKDTARNIFGDKVARELKDVWGLDEEGELKSVWRGSGHPGLWFAAGNLALARYYSRLLALQIKAVEEGWMSSA
ncbi:FAD/NAD(P)-binding domain-containing protein [Delitschia confertaspora ATCC 74209]|uniref:FAD/NAD(P)-binding domain-containing protein n=1 Tax=Delitschia confertaspora ATCC 74209 TaxID=1513339 RepID=A0A9P4MYH0_9PLEO|nr:FAD/NAD(P)-binding domain-containing protein [Delitschia confertaspora ATCC 74209]